MKNYEKPIVLANSELSEGVFAASGGYQGSPDYNINAYVHQQTETGRQDYRVQVGGTYNNSSDENNNSNHVLVVQFDQPVEIVGCGYECYLGENNTVCIKYPTGANSSADFGLGDLIVKPVTDTGSLGVVGATGYGS